MSIEKAQECYKAAKYLKKLLEIDLKPKDILTRQSFLNAVTLVNVIGGSTNAVLHLLAMARAADVELTIDDFQAVRDRTPYLCDLKCVMSYTYVASADIGSTDPRASSSWRTSTRPVVSPRSSSTSSSTPTSSTAAS